MEQKIRADIDGRFSNSPLGTEYNANGWRFEGVFDAKGNPIYGTITNEKGEKVYEGEIYEDMLFYFQQYDKNIMKKGS